MSSEVHETGDAAAIRKLLVRWAEATRAGRQDEILSAHLSNALIYDVLAPMKYEGTAAYRASWDAWQPELQPESEGMFDLEDLVVTATADLAFAHGFIRCGGTAPDGDSFEDLVRATFCLTKVGGEWKVAHQHISKPIEPGTEVTEAEVPPSS